MTTIEDVYKELKQVYDPEIPVNIIDLGLVYDVKLEPSGVCNITMTLTSQACPEARTIPEVMKRRVNSLPGAISPRTSDCRSGARIRAATPLAARYPIGERVSAGSLYEEESRVPPAESDGGLLRRAPLRTRVTGRLSSPRHRPAEERWDSS
jgi:metal-sulfur cluster biosynthetic enzyme